MAHERNRSARHVGSAIVELCRRLVDLGAIQRSDGTVVMDTLDTVQRYVQASEHWLALEVMLRGCDTELLSQDERRAIVGIVEDLSYEMWAEPGAADDWVGQTLTAGPNRPYWDFEGQADSPPTGVQRARQ